MKHSKAFLLVLSSLLLVSCEENSTSLSSGSESGSVSSETSPFLPPSSEDFQFEATPESVYLALNEAGEQCSYRADYPLGESTYYDILTPRYSYSSLTLSGQVLLPYYDTSVTDKDVLYSYGTDEEGKVEIGSLLLGEDNTFLTSLDSYNIFRLIDDPKYKVTQSAFEEDENGIYSDDVIVLLAFAALTGHGMEGLQGVFSRIRFSFFEDRPSVLGFDILGKALDGSGKLISFQTGEISQVGTAVEPSYDSLLRRYSLPEKTLSEEDFSLLMADSLKASSEVTLHSGDEDPLIVLQQEVSFDGSHLLIESQEEGRTISHYYEKQGNDTVERGLDSENEPLSIPMGLSFEDLSFPKDFLDPKAFRSSDGIHYHYFGKDAAALIYSLTYLPSLVPERIEAVKGKDGLILHFTTEKEYSDTEALTSYYDVVTSFHTPDSFQAPSSYSASSESEEIRPLLEKLSAGKQFRATIENLSGDNTVTTLTVEKNALLKDVVKGDSIIRFAYLESKYGLFSFSVSADGKVAKTGFQSGKGFADILPTLGKAEVYEKSGENAFALKSDVIGLKNYFGGALLPYALPSTIRLFYEDDHITRLYYRYSYSAQEREVQGAEAVNFDQYGTAIIPTGIRKQMEDLITLGA
ncbi:MAG: hypothetical protein PUA93_01280 [Eubacteriales bacterium]|nr:hypothetical protein [Eubacteriales bacterium]